MGNMEPSDESLTLLARMSAKPGVQSTLILSRSDGAIVRADGLLALKRRRASSSSTAAAAVDSSSAGVPNTTTSPTRTFATPSKPSSANNTSGSVRNSVVAAASSRKEDGEGRQRGEEVARTVWRYVQATEELVGELDEEDEVKLLRVRTKKNELVIVPSAKFLLVVVHDTPPA